MERVNFTNIFWATFFRTKVVQVSFWNLNSRLILLWHKKIGAKGALKMLVKLTPDETRRIDILDRETIWELICKLLSLSLSLSLFLSLSHTQSLYNAQIFECLKSLEGLMHVHRENGNCVTLLFDDYKACCQIMQIPSYRKIATPKLDII